MRSSDAALLSEIAQLLLPASTRNELTEAVMQEAVTAAELDLLWHDRSQVFNSDVREQHFDYVCRGLLRLIPDYDPAIGVVPSMHTMVTMVRVLPDTAEQLVRIIGPKMIVLRARISFHPDVYEVLAPNLAAGNYAAFMRALDSGSDQVIVNTLVHDTYTWALRDLVERTYPDKANRFVTQAVQVHKPSLSTSETVKVVECVLRLMESGTLPGVSLPSLVDSLS